MSLVLRENKWAKLTIQVHKFVEDMLMIYNFLGSEEDMLMIYKFLFFFPKNQSMFSLSENAGLLSDCQAPQWLRRSVGWNVNGFISTK
jgi:hypothetical protein